jgi:hypothetical protein
MASGSRAPTRVFELDPHAAPAPLRDAAAGHHHRARSAVAAVGLERQPPARPARLPSDRPGPRGPGGLRRVHCSLAQLHPAPCCSLRAWGCLVKGRLVASSYPALPRTALRRLALCDEKDASHRLLQPTPFTSTLRTAVFPAAFVAAPRLAAGRHARRTGSPWAVAERREILGRPRCPRSR